MSPFVTKTLISLGLFAAVSTQAAANETLNNWNEVLRTKVEAVNTYPTEALARGFEGTVKLRLTFAANGEVAGVEMVERSGIAILDARAMRSALNIRNMPALPEGRNELSLVVPVRFELKDRG